MRKRMFLQGLALAISVAIPLAAGDLSSQIVTVTETKTLDAAPAGTLHLENSRGAVNIEGWDQPRVEITVIKSTTGLFHAPDAARHLLEHAQIKSDRNGDEILISTLVPRHDRGELEIQYSIKAPRESKIVIDRGNGSVYVMGMAGDMQANMGQGQITLTLPENAEYAIDARAKAGEVYSDSDGDSGGKNQRHHLLGHGFTKGPATSAHKLYLRVCFGDIVITKAYTKHAS
jgi:hypothetical protein